MALGLLEHPVHPPLTHFALALPVTSLLWDAVSLWRPGAPWPELAYWTLAAGLAAGGAALVAGMVDAFRFVWVKAVPPPRASRLLVWHISLVLTAGLALALGIWQRNAALHAPGSPPSHVALGLSVLGVAALLAAGWLGGEMVYGERVGVAPERRSEQTGTTGTSL